MASRIEALLGLQPSLPTTTTIKPGSLPPGNKLIFVPNTIRRSKRQASNNYAKPQTPNDAKCQIMKPLATLTDGTTHRLARRAERAWPDTTAAGPRLVHLAILGKPGWAGFHQQ